MSYQEERLREIAGAIRAKKGNGGTIRGTSFAEEILGLEGTDTSDATAVAGDIRAGATAYARGAEVTGTLEAYAGATNVRPAPDSQTLYTRGRYMADDVTVEGYGSEAFKVSARISRSYAGGAYIPADMRYFSGKARGVCGYTRFSGGQYRHFFVLFEEGVSAGQGSGDGQVARPYREVNGEYQFVPNGSGGVVYYYILGI